jgi:bifunctional NMN adenylyltransferase/nudix hydrolase
MANIKDVTVYIGRFNPFHLGHAYVLANALETSKLVIVLVGSSEQSRSPKNPFNFAERREMIDTWEIQRRGWEQANQPGGNWGSLMVLPIRDFASNNLWIKSVQKTVKSAMTKFCLERDIILTDIHITGSDRDDTTWYLDAFPQWKKALVPAKSHNPDRHDDLSATSVRQVLFESQMALQQVATLSHKLPASTMRFLVRFMQENREEMDRLRLEHVTIKKGKADWAMAPFPVSFNTADAVIIQSGHVLMVKRGNIPGYGLWALPGGYVNQNERIRAAAIREAFEETGILLTTGKNAEEITKRMLDGSIRDKEIFDNPKRSERGRIITVAYLMRLDDTKPLPKVAGQNVPAYEADGKEIVETLEAKWLPISWVHENTHLIFEDHSQIVEWAEAQMD